MHCGNLRPIGFALLLLSFMLMVYPSILHQILAQPPSTVVRVDPQTISAKVDDMFSVNITVVDVENLYGVEAILIWNPSVLESKSVNIRLGQPDGVLFGLPLIIENNLTSGKYVLSATSTNPTPPFNGSGNVVQLTFRVAANGNSQLDLESELYDYPPPDRFPRISYPIEHTTMDGWFETVVPEFPNAAFIAPTFMLVAGMIIALKASLKKPSDKHDYSNIGSSATKAISKEHENKNRRRPQ